MLVLFTYEVWRGRKKNNKTNGTLGIIDQRMNTEGLICVYVWRRFVRKAKNSTQIRRRIELVEWSVCSKVLIEK